MLAFSIWPLLSRHINTTTMIISLYFCLSYSLLTYAIFQVLIRGLFMLFCVRGDMHPLAVGFPGGKLICSKKILCEI